MNECKSDVNESWEESLHCLATFYIKNGPFDGVFAITQGCVIATNFSHPTIWKERFCMEQCPWKFAILSIPAGHFSKSIEKYSVPINISSFHIFGEKYEFLSQRKIIATFWDPSQQTILSHSGGHELSPKLVTSELIALLDNFIDKQDSRLQLRRLDKEFKMILCQQQELHDMLLK